MRLFKKIWISLLTISMISQVIHADNGNTLYYYSKTSLIPSKISLDDLDKITFSVYGIQMWKKNEMEEIRFDDFLIFTFTEIGHPYISSMKSPITSQNVQISYEVNQKLLIVESKQSLNGVSIYDLQGRIVLNDATLNSRYCINTSTIPNGIYLVKIFYDGKLIIYKIVL